jgi:hypothetical protein
MLQRHNHRCGSHFAGADVAVNSVCVEVDCVACFDVVRCLTVPDIERSRQQIKKLATGVLVCPRHTAILLGEKLREIRIELAVRNQVPQALKEVRRVIGAGLRQAHSLVAAMHPEQRLRLRVEKVAQVL